ncbi:MAG TPA: asparagine synthase (glutamine-hydrolyzing) [Candidatus Polarisedimenticolia bacterium]|nr:asparagine synthase (glutamine-hydrolyzing) [Candidatus Polarisedimenticolia bacterium]
MCGIAGIVSFGGAPASVDDLHAMCGSMVHRGPDDYGFHVEAQAALGMRRLSIIDLDTGRQPVSNEDGSVWVVFNGEIYNYRELRRRLESQGHRFSTASDTETIVHLYEEYGPDLVEHLRGMFALAVWDRGRRALLLARDRFGIKPLYYTVHEGKLIFASELKAILQVPGVPRDLSWPAVGHVFTFLSTPPAESIVAGIRKLEPAHRLAASQERGLLVERYWRLRFEPDYRLKEEEFAVRLRELLRESVALHMVSDVPVGAFLSGGIDSSSVVAAMAGVSGEPVKTFSIGFPDQDFDELRHARMVARRFGTDHHEMVLEPDAVPLIEDLAWYLDEPFGDSSALPTYMVSRLAAEHVTVVLSGDGGDEVFAGYDRYVIESRERALRFLPLPARRALGLASRLMPDGMRGRNFLRHISLDGARRYLDAATLFPPEQMRRLLRRGAWAQVEREDPLRGRLALLDGAGGHWLSALQTLDMASYLPLDILTKVDRMSMAHSIEARVPLLDHKLVEFAATVPPELRLRAGRRKHIFKEAMKGVLPAEIIDRPKRGFAAPLGRWFRGHLGSYVRDLLLSDRCRRRGILDTSYIGTLLERHDRGRDLDLHLWTLISFELWCRRFLDQPPARAAGAEARRVPPRAASPGARA